MYRYLLIITIFTTLFAGLQLTADENTEDFSVYLKPSESIGSDNPDIVRAATEITAGLKTDVEKARALYEFVRDMKRAENVSCGEELSASGMLKCRANGCYGRSVLLAALCRAARIPARLHIQKVTLKDWKDEKGNVADNTFAHLLAGIYLNGHWRVYETVGNGDKWVQWTQDEKYRSEMPVIFSPDRDCLFKTNEKVPVLELMPEHFTGWNQDLINAITKIDGGKYLK